MARGAFSLQERMTPAMMERRKAITLTVVLVFLCSSLSFFAGAANLVPRLNQLVTSTAPQAENGTTAAKGIDYKQLDLVQQKILSEFVNPIGTDKLTEGALKGMVEATGDKYSYYMNPKEFKSFREHLESTFSGIGVNVELSPKSGLVTVVRPIPGSPGEKAGLHAGDSIVAVDGKDIKGMTLDEAVQLIRGPKGSKVKLGVQREGTKDALEFTITRDTIESPSTISKMLEPGIGYIQLTEFRENVTQQVSKALSDLRSQGATRIVFDLRQDPGGLLEEAIGVSSLFLPPKVPVVHIVSKDGEKETHVSRSKAPFDLPVVVLVDGMSASASEIVSGAIKDNKAGVLMGVKTFGKGSVQTFFTLPDGSGLKLTTAKYLTAGGISIHEKGIEPDVVVENPKGILPGDKGDVQLQEAIKYIKTMKR